MLIPFLLEKYSGSVIAGMRLQYPGAKNSTPAFSLLCDFEILHPVITEEVANNHLSLGFTVRI
jgi:hypothetical protein